MVARAMGNFGWSQLRLVKPRDGWPSASASATASNSRAIVEEAQLFGAVDEAVADLSLVLVTSARKHDMVKPVIGPAEAATRACAHAGRSGAPAEGGGQPARVGYIFGREAWGLTNDEVSAGNAIVTLPVDPERASLNLAQCVLLCAYEWRLAAFRASGFDSEPTLLPVEQVDRGPVATQADLTGFYEHLEGLLAARGFFHPPEKRDRMVRNLRAIFQRGDLTAQEVRTLRGVLASLDRAHERR
ncbi:MAG: RNA methyltransferase [Devosiaceae bacterium]|nr:RNA methyltransferase [Devosiaceae bacterium MH13]